MYNNQKGKFMSNVIANTIVKQLGGNRFAMMTGAKDFLALSDGVVFKVGRNSGKCNYVRIKLNSMDLYDVEYIRMRNGEEKILKKENDLYNDMIVRSFEEFTGMYTKIF